MEVTDTHPPKPLSVILLATDGSEFSLGTERVALAMAVQHHAHVHLLRLLMAPADTPEAAVEEEETRQQMAVLQEQCTSRGLACTPMIRRATEPSQGILDAAREIQAELVVIGRRGKRGLARFMVGAATTKVIEQAECMVLVVPRLVTIWNSGILLVAHPEHAGDPAVNAACRVAHVANLPVTMLMVADEDESGDERREANQLVNRMVALAKQQGIEASGMVQAGDIDEVPLEVARQRSADLFVSEYRDDRSLMERLFNTPTLIHLIGKAQCPVLVAR